MRILLAYFVLRIAYFVTLKYGIRKDLTLKTYLFPLKDSPCNSPLTGSPAPLLN